MAGGSDPVMRYVNAHVDGIGVGVEALLGRDVAVVAGAEAQNLTEGCPGNIDLTYRGRRRVPRVVASAAAGKHAQQEKGQNEMIRVPLHAEYCIYFLRMIEGLLTRGAGDGDALALSTGISLGLWFMRSARSTEVSAP
jgi:hypothetical protein